MEILYTAAATTEGGRDGKVKSESGRIEMPMRMPKALGGDEQGTNPEELFAAGYSACFGSALQVVAKEAGKSIDGFKVTAHISIGKGEDGFGLKGKLDVEIPNMDKAEAQELTNKAHQICPYSKATRNNIEVEVEAV